MTDSKFHFSLLDAGKTNIHFNNKITESDSVNIFINEYMYNGSGVGIGDFNNDGLPDIFLCGSMVSSKLFINKGDFSFEDVTDKAGLQTDKWCTGVSVVDINNDGYQDIYVCSSHARDGEARKNLLFINDGKLHFSEEATAYGLADTGFATQAAFFDYDKDGDVDMYLLNHRIYSHTANNLQPKDTSGYSPAADKLYRNDGVQAGQTHPIFLDVSIDAGIKEDGYGLGIVVTDVNNDNWPDIYVANDYIANDILWLNNSNGTFSNVIATSMKHQSYNSMGVDAADINNDLFPDLATLDMLPENNERKKMMVNSTSQEKYDMQLRFGYEPSYMRNMLQLNNGKREMNGKAEPFYSEIGQLAGISETDWSWSILMTDFDNDGWKDIYITNGLGKDVTNNDYATFRNTKNHSNNYTFGSGDANQKSGNGNSDIKELRKEIDEYGSVKMDNYFFKNKGDLTFSNITKQTGLAIPSISNGAAYADLDNDGDLDLVVNNINQDVFIYKNEIRNSANDSTKNFLSIELKGPAGNISGFGCKATLFSNNTKQYLEQSPVRGFSSSVDGRLHFGIRNSNAIDSLKIQWPDNKIQVIKNIKANQFIIVKYADAATVFSGTDNLKITGLFTDITDQSGVDFKHTEMQNYDFGNRQPLQQRYSQLGPCIATADINGDGLIDFFVGGAANQPGKIFIQQKDREFISKNLVDGTKTQEDLGAIFFDSDGDKDFDLLITGGSSEFGVEKYNQPQLYINDGTGNFKIAKGALPEIMAVTKAVVAADYDGDGDLDIFIGGRLQWHKYSESPRSYILRNEKGKFVDATKDICPALEYGGLIDAAIFTDFNNDQKPDLIVSGEWMPVRFFRNENNKLKEITKETGLGNMYAWWRSLEQADIDNDGDMDYIAGNMGLNNKYHIAPDKPMMLYAKDMDKNGSLDLIPAYYIKDNNDSYQLFPEPDRNQLSDQVPSIKKKYLRHKDYSKATMGEVQNYFGAEDWTILKCETFSTVWIENLGNGKFKSHELPMEAQLAPVNSIVAADINDDGNIDLIIAGNEYQSAFSTGRYDASYGLVLKGNGKGNFLPCHYTESGLIIDGDVKAMKMISLNNKRNVLLVAPNDSRLRVFLLN
ncbi:MAG: VCBS repeat-containing protein [Chitinophagaceae bacterium]